MNKNQKIQKFLTAMFIGIACFITQAWAQDLTDESRQSIETNASTVLTKGNSTEAARNFVVAAPAATFTVNNSGDAGDANTADGICATSTNVCTLRAAVQQANATAGDDTINFAIPAGDAGCTAGGVCTITLTNGELFIRNATAAGSLTITNGTGANNLLISGNNTSRVFFVSNTSLTLDGVTITNGNGMSGTTNTSLDGFGGGISNTTGSMLTLTNSKVSGNSAGSRGGAIFINCCSNSGGITLINTTVSNNTAGNSGGGISFEGGTLTITGSTVSDNTAQADGGGINNNNTATTITLTNSTVSGNTASGSGGILNVGTLNLTSVTVTNNRSTNTSCTFCTGGIRHSTFGTANLNNTIVAGNIVANTSSSPDFSGAVSSTSSFNIIGNNRGTTGITNGTNGNQVGTPTNPIDPRLEPLANNGGPTQTHALRSDSPAIDKGSSFGLTTDQRGFTRPVDSAAYSNAADGADIGAFERQPEIVTAASITIGGRVTTAFGRGISRAVITLTDLNGNSVSTFTNSSGFYRFNDVTAGATYVVSARSKRYRFIQSSQAVNATEDLAEVNFIAAGY